MKLETDKASDWGEVGKLPLYARTLLEPHLLQFFEQNGPELSRLSDSLASDKVSSAQYWLDLHLKFFRDGTWPKGLESPTTVGMISPEVAANFREKARARQLPPKIAKEFQIQAPFRSHLLVVNHAASIFDAKCKTKPGTDALIQAFRAQKRSVLFSIGDDELADFSWCTSDRNPDFSIYSDGGEHDLKIDTPELTVVGGNLTLCLSTFVRDAIRSYFQRNDKNFRVNLPLDAIYQGEHLALDLLKEAQAPRAFLKAVFGKKLSDSNLWFLARGEGAQEYTVIFYLDDAEVKRIGQGAKQIELRLWTPDAFANYLKLQNPSTGHESPVFDPKAGVLGL